MRKRQKEKVCVDVDVDVRDKERGLDVCLSKIVGEREWRENMFRRICECVIERWRDRKKKIVIVCVLETESECVRVCVRE